MKRPLFLDQPGFSQRTPRVDQSQVDYASSLEHQAQRSWALAHWIVGLIGLGLLGALALGWLG